LLLHVAPSPNFRRHGFYGSAVHVRCSSRKPQAPCSISLTSVGSSSSVHIVRSSWQHPLGRSECCCRRSAIIDKKSRGASSHWPYVTSEQRPGCALRVTLRWLRMFRIRLLRRWLSTRSSDPLPTRSATQPSQQQLTRSGQPAFHFLT
jgi:hypothetical protein